MLKMILKQWNSLFEIQELALCFNVSHAPQTYVYMAYNIVSCYNKDATHNNMLSIIIVLYFEVMRNPVPLYEASKNKSVLVVAQQLPLYAWTTVSVHLSTVIYCLIALSC